MEQYSCNLCAATFSSNKSLLRHMRCKHPVGDVEKFVCALCEYSTPRADNLKLHVNTIHSSTEKFSCNLCSGTFGCKKNLNRHIRSKHPAGDQKYTCASCEYSTPRKDTLKEHEKTAHKTQVLCALCEFRSLKRKGMLQHYRLMHALSICEENHEFCSEGEFFKWKEQVEKDTICEFVHERSQYVSVPDQSRKMYFKCHRDGVYKPCGSNVRHRKILGTNKIGGYCPSRMDVTIFSSGSVKVTFYSTHVGHESEIGRLRLSKSEREEIAKKVAMKIPFDHILDSFRYVIQDDGLQRQNLLSRKDIHNIAQSYNLNSEAVRHRNDCTSVESWVKEMEETGSVVQFYKSQGDTSEEYSNLRKEDFVLIIMNEVQKDMLSKFGSNCVCLDSTHGLNEYGFELTTLLVLDELWQGFPCAFMFSNRGDHTVMEIFLNVIKNTLQVPIHANILMSDMADVFYNAWCTVMPIPNHRLFCSWHVDRAWRKNLCKIKGRENQAQVYKLIRTLMEHDDQQSFHEILEEAISYMKTDPDISEFGMYFEKIYKATYANWAYCFRPHNGLNTNMHLERMHGVIKHIYLQGKKPKRLDIAIHALMRYLRDRLYDRLVHLNKGKVTSKISAIRQRHKSSLQLAPELIICGDGEWQVPSAANKQTTYVVKKLGYSPCKCELRCTDCKACIHEYICSCVDSAIKFNMCKHVHLICRYIATKVSRESESSDTDLVICEAVSGDNQSLIVKELQNPGKSRQCGTQGHSREKLLQQFNLCLDVAKSEEAKEVISKCLSSLMPTLQALESTATLPPPSLSKMSKCEPQKRFVATKRKREITSLAITKPNTSERKGIVAGLSTTPQVE